MLALGRVTTFRQSTIFRKLIPRSREAIHDLGTHHATLRRSQEAPPGDGPGARAAGSAPPGRRPAGRVPARRPGPDLADAAVRGLRRLPDAGRVPRPLGLPAPGRQRRPVGRRPEGRVDPAGRRLPPLPAGGAEGRADRGHRRADRGPRPAARPARLGRRPGLDAGRGRRRLRRPAAGPPRGGARGAGRLRPRGGRAGLHGLAADDRRPRRRRHRHRPGVRADRGAAAAAGAGERVPARGGRRGPAPSASWSASGPALEAVARQIDLVAPTDAAVLILGESGTGKELVAREMHRRSGRRHGR